jgi:glutamate carboxypeptidase
MADCVERWANLNTHSYNPSGLSKLADQVSGRLTDLGLNVERLPLPPARLLAANGQMQEFALGPALRARKRADAALRILLNIHIDTVYSIDDPFQTVTRPDANTLKGPGVIDAKGGLVVLLTALEAIEKSDVAQNIGWDVLINPDEEIGSPGSTPLLLQCAKENHLALLFEPALPDGSIVGERKGSGGFSLIVRGRAAHAGRDFDQGRSAIVAVAEAVGRLHAINGQIPGVIVNVGRIDGGGAANVVPDLAIARINVRTSAPEDESRVRKRLELIVNELKAREGIRAELQGGAFSPPKLLDDRSRRLSDHVIACARELGLNLSRKPSGGASDGNRLAAAGLPVVDSMGPRGGKLHSPEEFLVIDSLVERAQLAALVLMKLGSREIRID